MIYITEINNNNNTKFNRGLNTSNVRMGFMIEFQEGISEAFCIEWGMGSSLGLSTWVAITDLQISPVFPWNLSQWDINVWVSEGNSPRALSNGACNVIVGKTITKT